MSRRWKRAILLLTSLAAPLLLIELGLRIQLMSRLRESGNRYARPIRLDERLGWRPSENYRTEDVLADAAGKPYRRSYSTDQDGFRARAGPRAGRSEVLFLGDSQTQAVPVSNEEIYGAVAGRRLGVEASIWGSGGYGTLQELMALDELIAEVRPSVVVLQLSDNDLVNNDFEAESRSHLNNNGMRRPYLGADGRVFYALPKPFASLWQFGWRHSLLLSHLLIHLNGAEANRPDTIENAMQRDGLSSPELKRSAATTELLLTRMRRRCASIRLEAFVDRIDSPYFELFRDLTRRAGVPFLENVPKAVHAAEMRGEVVRAADKEHWAPRGHAIAGEALAEALRAELVATR